MTGFARVGQGGHQPTTANRSKEGHVRKGVESGIAALGALIQRCSRSYIESFLAALGRYIGRLGRDRRPRKADGRFGQGASL